VCGGGAGTCDVDPNDRAAITTIWDWVDQVNDVTFAGHTDWRLASVNQEGEVAELETILLEPYPCGTSPCIDPIFGPTAASVYWSSTTYSNPDGAWYVHFRSGGVVYVSKYIDDYVRAVRGGP
jgi:hypothetical protein